MMEATWGVFKACREDCDKLVDLMVDLAKVASVEFDANAWQGPLGSIFVRVSGRDYRLDNREAARFLGLLNTIQSHALGNDLSHRIERLTDGFVQGDLHLPSATEPPA